MYPGHLRTGVQPMAACQERQRIDIAAEVRPLAGAEPAVNGDEETHRRIEELVIAFNLLVPSDAILTGVRALRIAPDQNASCG